MKQKPSSKRRRSNTKSVLRLPDLEHAKTAVLNSLNSADAKRGYRHTVDKFVDWYCSEPRLAFDRIVVLCYRSHLETRQLTPGTINLSLGAVRRQEKKAQIERRLAHFEGGLQDQRRLKLSQTSHSSNSTCQIAAH
jgi:hypothetical protein